MAVFSLTATPPFKVIPTEGPKNSKFARSPDPTNMRTIGRHATCHPKCYGRTDFNRKICTTSTAVSNPHHLHSGARRSALSLDRNKHIILPRALLPHAIVPPPPPRRQRIRCCSCVLACESENGTVSSSIAGFLEFTLPMPDSPVVPKNPAPAGCIPRSLHSTKTHMPFSE